MLVRIKIASIDDVPVFLHLTWFIVFAANCSWFLNLDKFFDTGFEHFSTLWKLLTATIVTVGVALSILTHELAHTWMAKKYGIKADGVTLFLFGGIATINNIGTLKPRQECHIALAGPLASFVLFNVFCTSLHRVPIWLGITWPTTIQVCLIYWTFFNYVVALFNLIPAFPADGGRVFHALLWKINGGYHWARYRCAQVSCLIALCLFVCGLLVMSLWIMGLSVMLSLAAIGSMARSKDFVEDEQHYLRMIRQRAMIENMILPKSCMRR